MACQIYDPVGFVLFHTKIYGEEPFPRGNDRCWGQPRVQLNPKRRQKINNGDPGLELSF